MLLCGAWRVTAAPIRCSGESIIGESERKRKKKVVVVGSGWAGLGAAHHLCNNGFEVTVIHGDGGVEDVGIRGYWYPYKNIFSLVDDLGIKPFTKRTKCAQYSEAGLEVEFPIYQDLPQLPTPLGPLLYTQFSQLAFAERLTLLPLMAAVIDFDNTDTAWRKYDPLTTRELLKQFGCSEKLFTKVIGPLLQVALFAPAEQCSAAATLGMLYYLILAHQKDFDMIWCRGTVREKIFGPWIESMRIKGCEFIKGVKVNDLTIDEETGCVSAVTCGGEFFNADAVILALDISTLQELIRNSPVLCERDEFFQALNLDTIDVLTVNIWLDKKVNLPYPSNACSGFGGSFGWTFFDLNAIHDEYKDSPGTVIQADFYNANELLPQKDEFIVTKLMSHLSRCIDGFESASVIDKEIKRFPKSLTHFFPGSYKYTMRGSTSFPNLFMAGDWIKNRHGSWGQEKSYVSGIEAANGVVDLAEEGRFAKIIAVEEDEPHVDALRGLNRRFIELASQFPLSNFFI